VSPSPSLTLSPRPTPTLAPPSILSPIESIVDSESDSDSDFESASVSTLVSGAVSTSTKPANFTEFCKASRGPAWVLNFSTIPRGSALLLRDLQSLLRIRPQLDSKPYEESALANLNACVFELLRNALTHRTIIGGIHTPSRMSRHDTTLPESDSKPGI